ncbi:hypothetical protein HS125_09630 [bacterium]|nr:hypothetical protein [bacterium]
MIQMRWTTYVLTLLAVAIGMSLWSLPGAVREAGAQVPPATRGRTVAPLTTTGEEGMRATPTYVVEEYTDTRTLERGLNNRAQQGYLVVSIEVVPTRIGNPNDQIPRVAYRNTLDVYQAWVVVYTR